MGHDTEGAAEVAAKGRWLDLQRIIWPVDDLTKDELAMVLRRQVDELAVAEGYHEVEELADIISLASKAIEERGFDVEKAMMLRLVSRHLTYEHAVAARERWRRGAQRKL